MHDRIELTPGNYQACDRCHARTGNAINGYGCEPKLLDGIKYRIPYFCPIREKLRKMTPAENTNLMVRELAIELRRRGKL